MKEMIFLLLLISTTCYSQKKFSTYAGLGMGGVIENKNLIPNCISKGSLRVTGFISQYYQVNSKVLIGLQVLASGDLIATAKCSQYTAATNTRLLSSNSMSATSYLLKGKYMLGTSSKLKPYLDLGIGMVTYSYGYVSTETEDGFSKSNLAVSTEIGIEVSKKLNLACIAIFGGKTPSFSGFDNFSAENKLLQSINSQQLYLTASYRLFQF